MFKVEATRTVAMISNFGHGKDKNNAELFKSITTDAARKTYPETGGRKVQMLWMAHNPNGYVAQLIGREFADDSEVTAAVKLAQKFGTIAKWPSTAQRDTVKSVLSAAVAEADKKPAAKKPAAKKNAA